MRRVRRRKRSLARCLVSSLRGCLRPIHRSPTTHRCHRRIRRIAMANWLLSSAVIVNLLLLCTGLTAALYDIEHHGWGLYLILVSIASFMMISAFCLVGTEAQKETIAQQFWESTRHTVRKYTPMLSRQPEPGDAMLTLAKAASTQHFQPDNADAHGSLELTFFVPIAAREPTITFASLPSPDEENEIEEIQL